MTREFTADERVKWLSGQHKIPASSVAAIEDPEGRLLVVKATYKAYWSMPGGIIDPGESPRDAVIREVEEEVGLSLSVGEVRFVGTIFRASNALDTYQFVFGASVGGELLSSIVLQEDEIADYAFVSREQVLEDASKYAPIVVRWAKNNIPLYHEERIEVL